MMPDVAMCRPFGRPAARLFVLAAFLICATACAAAPTPPAATPLPPSPTPTATFVFPTMVPTSTITPAPTATATPDILSALGAVILREDFSNTDEWPVGEDAAGGTSLRDSQLFIAVRKPDTFRSALAPSVYIASFYALVTVRPQLCTANDEFGLIFRLTPEGNHFRFGLNCAGLAKVTRVVNNLSAPLIPPTATDYVLPGPLVPNRIAVLAQGPDFRFYLNDHEVFRLRDISLPAGAIGLYVRSGDGGQATVAFSDLVIYEAPHPILGAGQPSPAPSGTPRPGS
jgi:hypothetical protein